VDAAPGYRTPLGAKPRTRTGLRNWSLEIVVIRIATRRSKLALAQSHWVKAQLEALHPGIAVELREYVTRGDRIQDVPLAQVGGGKGMFTKEIEDALLSGDADVAVHSLKDLPAEMPPGLVLAAVPLREDPRDAIVLPLLQVGGGSGFRVQGSEGSRRAAERERDSHSALRTPHSALPIPEGALVGSSSVRRSAQVLYARPDLRVESVRGNVDTRLRKLDEGQYDALILAAAGLRRLGLEARISSPVPEEISTPAPGQGALGLECREGDEATRGLLARLEDPHSRWCVTAERALMDTLGGGCSVPLGALARVERGTLSLTGVVAVPDGSRLVRESAAGPVEDPQALGRAVAEALFAAGAREILGRS
jgi:hydroxymethylbilane synthase